ncbi:nitroreductase family deazaflavin-dependent oxidoreductase [Streptomyces sp. NPDC005248]|uniref:nitroreductase family deazaflavin-dependent oxidoreductase n=1 Tax=Streptomyces sp. NPDC005248 TaxID=3364709 RepID=UPI00369114F9
MPQTDPKPSLLPVGWRRRAARLPIPLFRMGLGPVFGKQLLLLHHTGRTTGLDRRVVLEVVAHDPAAGSWTVASGFGPRSDWYRNLRAEPQTLIQFGNQHHTVTAHFLTRDDSAEIMARYGRQRPRTARRLRAFFDLAANGSDAAFRAAGSAIPVVRLDDAGPWSF